MEQDQAAKLRGGQVDNLRIPLALQDGFLCCKFCYRHREICGDA